MHYTTIYDLTSQTYDGWFLGIGLLFAIIGAVLALKPSLFVRLFSPNWISRDPKRTRAFGLVFSGFAALWTLSVFASTYGEYSRARNALLHGNFQVVEGVVTDYDADHAKKESFSVAGRSFSYSDYIVTAGFHNMAVKGGPIREGLQVRITYIDNTILKLESRMI